MTVGEWKVTNAKIIFKHSWHCATKHANCYLIDQSKNMPTLLGTAQQSGCLALCNKKVFFFNTKDRISQYYWKLNKKAYQPFSFFFFFLNHQSNNISTLFGTVQQCMYKCLFFFQQGKKKNNSKLLETSQQSTYSVFFKIEIRIF